MKNILRVVVVILFYSLVSVVCASAQFINDMTDYQLKQAARQFHVSDLRVGTSAWVRPFYCVKGNRIYMTPDSWLLPKEVTTLNIRFKVKRLSYNKVSITLYKSKYHSDSTSFSSRAEGSSIKDFYQDYSLFSFGCAEHGNLAVESINGVKKLSKVNKTKLK